MLSALRYSNIAVNAVVEKGIDFLLSNQSVNGSWDGGHFPIPDKRYMKKEYVMATSLSMRVLRSVQN
jgi:hypothetical protein